MSVNPPAIVKLSEVVLVALEQAVIGFARAHKYQTGADLRADARAVARCAQRAWRNASSETISHLSNAIDELKISLQLAKGVKAFKSFAQFETIARDVDNLGRQCGGWQKKHLKGQNRRTASSDGRAQILSAGDASQEANG